MPRSSKVRSFLGMFLASSISQLRLWGSSHWQLRARGDRGRSKKRLLSPGREAVCVCGGGGGGGNSDGPVGQSSWDLTCLMPGKHKQQSYQSPLSAGTRNGSSLYRPKNEWCPPFHTRQALALSWHFSFSPPGAVAHNKKAWCLLPWPKSSKDSNPNRVEHFWRSIPSTWPTLAITWTGHLDLPCSTQTPGE